jgi:hypothetical protein
MRGKFNVTDPSAVKDLKLSVRFRGGLVAYLNGQEIARTAVPDAGASLEALADDYPVEAFVSADGTIISLPPRDATNDAELLRRLRLRVRTCDVTIPAEKLQKGVNVLAMEIHRAPYRPEMLSLTRTAQPHVIPIMLWATCDLLTVRLSNAGGGRGPQSQQNAIGDPITPNVHRPAGLQAWNSQTINSDMDADYGDPNEPLAPIRLVGTRNGSVSCKLRLGSDKPIKGLKASLGELSGPATSSGQAKIPASAVHIRFAQPDGWEATLTGTWTLLPAMLDGLAETAPAEVPMGRIDGIGGDYLMPGQIATRPGAVTAVWVTVEVPKDAAAGDYKADLTVSADGAEPIKAPVQLRVCPWRAPPPSEFKTVMDVMQSPESVALRYNVEPYSDQHFKLLEKSLDRLGYAGNWTLYCPLVCQTNHGNEQSMVRWVKQADGSWGFDYAPFEKYLDLAIQHMGKPRIVVLYVWDLHIPGSRTGVQDDSRMPGIAVGSADVPVTQLVDGKPTPLGVHYDEANKPAWKALAAGVMERLAKRGLDKTPQLGLGSDARPSKDIIAYLGDIFPNLLWAPGGHQEWTTMGTTSAKVGMGANVYPYKFVDNWHTGVYSCYGWKRDMMRLIYPRTNQPHLPVTLIRLLPEMSITGPQHGLGHIGLDFWPVLKGNRTIHARYAASSWLQNDAIIKAFVPAGPDGAMDSVRLEMLREGLQESEARIFIEMALTDKACRAKLGEDLTARCQRALDERAVSWLPNLDHQPTAGFQTKVYDQVLLGTSVRLTFG